MWNPDQPNDFDRFTPTDLPLFLEWWERRGSEAIAVQLAGGFIEGATYPYLRLLQTDPDQLPPWVRTLLIWRGQAQWAYEQGIALTQRLERGLPGLQGIVYPVPLRLTPQHFAEIPPAIQNGFIEGNRFSLQWVKRLSGEARQVIGDLMAANALQNRNPSDAIPLLETVLRREAIAHKLGINPNQVDAAMLEQWLQTAAFDTAKKIAYRADLIAVTEGMRMANLGIMAEMESRQEVNCYVMPHRGTCPECQRLIDGRVFEIARLKQDMMVNFGKKKTAWVATIPQHPRCRHSIMDVPFKFRRALRGVPIPREGLLLEWYGLPGGKEAFEALALPRLPWLTPAGKVA